MHIKVTGLFARSYKRLPLDIERTAEKQERIFRENPFDTSLKTHKLHGKYKDYWAFSVNTSYRILFTFEDKRIAVFIDIGTHSIYT